MEWNSIAKQAAFDALECFDKRCMRYMKRYGDPAAKFHVLSSNTSWPLQLAEFEDRWTYKSSDSKHKDIALRYLNQLVGDSEKFCSDTTVTKYHVDFVRSYLLQ